LKLGENVRRLHVVLALVALGLAACAESDGEIDLSDVRVAEPTGPNAALYLTAVSDLGDRLIGVETDVAASVQIHETVMGADGTMGMRSVESLEVNSGETLTLEPGGVHLMLVDAERLQVGDEVEITLIWENAGEQTVVAEVVEPADAMNHDDDG